MNLFTLDKSVLIPLVVFQEMVCLNTIRSGVFFKKTGHTTLDWAYLHHNTDPEGSGHIHVARTSYKYVPNTSLT